MEIDVLGHIVPDKGIQTNPKEGGGDMEMVHSNKHHRGM